jgi:hypothetical protein
MGVCYNENTPALLRTVSILSLWNGRLSMSNRKASGSLLRSSTKYMKKGIVGGVSVRMSCFQNYLTVFD